MLRLRHATLAAFLALALAFAQHAAVVHGLGHATQQVQGHEKPGAPLEQKCDTHYACAQLAGAAPASPPTVPRLEPGASPQSFFLASEALQPARLAFRSRAPPA